MSFKIRRPPTQTEVKLIREAEQYAKQAQVMFAENVFLRAKIVNMMQGEGWRMRFARWLICRDEARRVAKVAASPGESDSAAGPTPPPGRQTHHSAGEPPPPSAPSRPTQSE